MECADSSCELAKGLIKGFVYSGISSMYFRLLKMLVSNVKVRRLAQDVQALRRSCSYPA